MKTVRILAVLFFSISLLGDLTWEKMFTEIDFDVREIKSGNVNGFDYIEYFFVSPDSGLIFYQDGNLNIHKQELGLRIKSADCIGEYMVTDNIIFVYGDGTESDGYEKYYPATDSTEFVGWLSNPSFIKWLSTGFYIASEEGLIFGNGDSWETVDNFLTTSIKDIEETSTGKIFLSARVRNVSNEVIFMKTESGYDSLNSGFGDINDIFIDSNNKVLITLGTGTYSDGLYEVSYNDTVITGIELIDYIFEANLIYEYTDSYIVSDKNGSGLTIVPKETGIARNHNHGLEIDSIYCFSTIKDLDTPNFLIGTNNGVYMCTGTTSIDPDMIGSISSYKLHQNYPNPFNPVTTISFDLNKTGNVKLTVFNFNGQVVKELVNDKMDAGYHTINFNAEGMNSGIYFYTLEVGNTKYARNMILVK
ncbi:MAG: T9SS type A sorting domain-containing protein [Candidatus Delongbacteria bacterium]|nr:T9SS type A sorting domain-containing protein [Candidatus Delongbacteria bacterium]